MFTSYINNQFSPLIIVKLLLLFSLYNLIIDFYWPIKKTRGEFFKEIVRDIFDSSNVVVTTIYILKVVGLLVSICLISYYQWFPVRSIWIVVLIFMSLLFFYMSMSFSRFLKNEILVLVMTYTISIVLLLIRYNVWSEVLSLVIMFFLLEIIKKKIMDNSTLVYKVDITIISIMIISTMIFLSMIENDNCYVYSSRAIIISMVAFLTIFLKRLLPKICSSIIYRLEITLLMLSVIMLISFGSGVYL